MVGKKYLDIFKGSIYQALAGVIIAIFNFAISIVVTRILNPLDFGIYSMATSILYFFIIFKEFGFSVAATHIIDEDEDLIFTTYFTLTILIEVLFLLLCIVFFGIIKKGYGLEISYSFIMLAAINSIGSIRTVFQTKNLKDGKFKLNAYIITVSNIVKGIVMILLAINGLGFYTLIIGDAVLMLLQLILFYGVCKFKPIALKIDLNILKRLLLFFYRYIKGSIASFISGYAHKFVTGNFAGIVNLGFYEKAYSLIFFTKMNVVDYILQVAGPIYSKNQNNLEELKIYLYLFSKNISRLTFFTASILFVIIPEFVVIFWGQKWLEVVWNLRAMSIFGAITPIYNNFELMFGYLGRPDLFLYTLGSFGIVTNSVGFVLINFFNEKGMAIALSVGSIITFFVAVFIINRKFFRFNAVDVIFVYLIAFLIVCAVGLALDKLVIDIYIKLFLKLALSIFIFLSFILFIEKKGFIEELKKFLLLLK
ncbi:MAG: oligosaccharide flippase family protein [bacterium]|nr:oligosaccharide flippase family protein [bacterium]